MWNRRRRSGKENQRRHTRFSPALEHLEARHLLAANPVLTEFMAANDNYITDEDGDSSDWLEILNAGDMDVDLRGWYLTDDATDLTKWRFPAFDLAAGESTIVFASNKDRDIPGRELHTNFRLSAEREYLALVEPDGVTVASEFAPDYPPQVTDVSFGIPTTAVTTTLLGDGSAARVLIPTNGSVDPVGDDIQGSWLDPNFDDTANGWFAANTGIGYETGAGTEVDLADSVQDWSASGTQGENSWYYGYYNRTADAGGDYETGDFVQFPDHYFAGVVWDWPDGNPPNTLIGQQNMHPNGLNAGGAEHWVIRRYVSEGSGSLEVTWTLRKSGLALGGNGVTGHVFHNGEEVDVVTIANSDTTGVTRVVTIDGVQAGDAVDFVVDPRGTDSLPFDTDDTVRLTASIRGISGIASNIHPDGDIETQMHNVGTSAYVRIPFTVENPAEFTTLRFDMRYGDGFIAYLNGLPVAAENTSAGANATYLETALADRDAPSTNSRESFDISSDLDLLTAGQNVLMIHGVNSSPSNNDFLLRPQLVATSLQLDFDNPRYFVVPTPGEVNGVGSEAVGPLFLGQDFTPLSVERTEFVNTDALARVHIPTDAGVDGQWQDVDFDDAGPGWFDATLGIGYEDSSNLPVTEIADSWDDWSSSGTQGENNWLYGYYNKTTDGDGVYSGAEFQQFPDDYYAGVVWDWPNGNPPNTLIGIQNMVPNGSEAGQIHWPVRRYVSEAGGSLTVDWKIQKSGLAAGGNGVTGHVFHNGAEVDTILLGGTNTTGISQVVTIPNVQVGDFIDFTVDPRGTDGGEDGSLDTTRLSATIDGQSSISGLIDVGGDIRSAIQGVSSSAYVRLPFTVGDEVAYDSLELSVNYDDGIVVFLNGEMVASRNVADAATAGYASTATAARTELDVLAAETIDLSEHAGLLNVGDNVLAIHVLNVSASDADLVLLPTLVGSGPAAQPAGGELPMDGDGIIVTTAVSESFHPVSDVTLHYRVMYGDEGATTMVDDGSGNDAVAGDGTYTATIPGNLAREGEMVRWYMTAADTAANQSRFPVFDSPTDSEEYFGTIVYDPEVESSNLPVIYWFIENPSRANTTSGSRASVYYDGEFYDNVLFDIHGQSTRGAAFLKKSYDVDFNRDHRFRWQDDVRRMKDINLLTNYADKGKFRNTLAYEVWGLAGGGTHLAEPVRVQQNGDFFAVYDFVEDGDDRFLERLGLDPEGALYKGYNNASTASGNQKITRKDEDFSDLQALIDGSTQLSGAERKAFLFDNIDIPAAVNFLAAMVVNANIDCCHKNWYAYRDTNRTGEWTFLPWDVDLTFGRLWTPTLNYFDDIIKINTGVPYGSMAPTTALFNTPEFREMYMRRVRTLMDAYLQPPGTPPSELYFENWLDEFVTLLDPHDDNPATGTDDADLDYQRWGSWGNGYTFRQEIDSVKSVFLPQRREYLYNTQTVGNGGEIPGSTAFEFTTLTDENGPVTAWVPTDDSLGDAWIEVGFDDGDWLQGTSGVGYERGSGYQPFIGLDLLSPSIPAAMRIDTNGDGQNENDSVYTRHAFTLSEVPELDNLTLQLRIDDGFVAYLNGVEVARGNFTGTPRWNSGADGNGTEASASFAAFDITPSIGLLQAGENVLAIHGLNQDPSSSDMIIQPVLASAVAIEGVADLTFGDFDYNPESGDQDQEYIQIVNNGTLAIDVSNWQVVGGVQHTIRPGTVIPAGGSVYLTPDVVAFRARTSGPSGGQGLFIQESYQGHLSNFGETVELRQVDGTLVDALSYVGDPTDVQQFLRVSEIMYNPPAPTPDELEIDAALDNDDFEFIELVNNSSNVTLDLNGVVVSQGFADPFLFAGSQVTSLAPGERVLIVHDLTAFEARYGAGRNVAGTFVGGLANDGEQIKVDDANGSSVVDFSYDDGVLWAQSADGVGASLVLANFDTPADQLSKYYSWRGSDEWGGSPGNAGADPIAVVINEVRSNTDDPNVLDAIELWNAGTTAVDISGWYLSDSAAELRKFQVPAGTLLDPGQYVVFDESQFHPEPGNPASSGFSLNGNEGDDVWLVVFAGDNLTTLVDDVHFGAVASGETLGRIAADNARLVPQGRDTLGCANTHGRVGPLVISEVQYHPVLPSAAALAAYPEITRDDLEFVEVHNPTAATVDLTEWRLRGGVDFEFDLGATIAAGETVVILPFNPDNPANVGRVAAFRAHYGIGSDVRLLGGFGGALSDSLERLQFQRPGTPVGDPQIIPRLWEDEVIYDDRAPWPISADGGGDSLQRSAPTYNGSHSTSWSPASPTPGSLGALAGVAGDFTGDGAVTNEDIDVLATAVSVGSTVSFYDLDGNGTADQADVLYLVENVLGTQLGDANLDGAVDASDFNRWNDNKFDTCYKSWGEGDFNGDGVADGSDFNVWSARRFTGAVAPRRFPLLIEHLTLPCRIVRCRPLRPWIRRFSARQAMPNHVIPSRAMPGHRVRRRRVTRTPREPRTSRLFLGCRPAPTLCDALEIPLIVPGD